MTILINLPQRFQAVDGAQPFDAGIHVLPVLLSSPVGTIIASQAVTRLDVPPFYPIVFGVAAQLLGLGLASSTSPGSSAIWGYEVILGLAFGTTLVTLLIYVPLAVKREDLGQ